MKSLTDIIAESYSDLLVTEGGASGHMTHLFEDPDLTFKQLKDIFTKLFTGKIGITEKTDGQALAITYKDGKVGASRNIATLKDPMSIEQVTAKFDGRGEVKDAFVKSMTDISKAINSLSEEEKQEIFNNGHNFMAFEIIYPPTKNVVDYGTRCLIQLHGVNIYDDKWHKVSEDKAIADKLFELLKSKHALKQDTFEITSDAKLQLKDSKTGKDSLAKVLDKLASLVDGLGWNATINDYAQERFEKYIINMAMKAEFDVAKRSDFVSKLAQRMSNISKSNVTKSDLATYAKQESIDIKDQKYKDFVNQVDATKDEANQYVIKPIEDLVIGAGLLLMKNLVGYVSTDPKASAKKLAIELQFAIDELANKETSLDDRKLARFKKNLAKLDQYQKELTGVEGIVFLYRGKVYKMTSTFGAVNQLMGIMKY